MGVIQSPGSPLRLSVAQDCVTVKQESGPPEMHGCDWLGSTPIRPLAVRIGEFSELAVMLFGRFCTCATRPCARPTEHSEYAERRAS